MNSEGGQPNAKDAKVPQRTQQEQSSNEEDCSHAVIGAAVEVQRVLGVGLLESAYAGALATELKLRGLRYEREVPISGSYKGADIGVQFRADFIVEQSLIVEIKACDGVSQAHRAQLLSYLRLTGRKIGLLINFHEFPVAKGVHRLVNKL
jgi:GxxExxY protein